LGFCAPKERVNYLLEVKREKFRLEADYFGVSHSTIESEEANR
jgi:hypothetical protein